MREIAGGWEILSIRARYCGKVDMRVYARDKDNGGAKFIFGGL